MENSDDSTILNTDGQDEMAVCPIIIGSQIYKNEEPPHKMGNQAFYIVLYIYIYSLRLQGGNLLWDKY